MNQLGSRKKRAAFSVSTEIESMVEKTAIINASWQNRKNSHQIT